MKWLPIDRDENGFATEECLDRIFNNLPCAVCSQEEGGYKYYNFVNEYLDMWHNREDIRTNTGYTHYLPTPKVRCMSYNTAYIDVWDKEGYLHQIHQVQGQLSFANAERCEDSARKIVREAFPEYKRAVLVIMHYDKNDYNDKSKELEL